MATDNVFQRLRRTFRTYRTTGSLASESSGSLSQMSSLKSASWLGLSSQTHQTHPLNPLPMEFVTNGPKFLALDCTGAQPTPRSGHVAVIDGQGVYLYVFGGYHEARCYNDLYRYHIPSRNWTRLACAGDIPAPRVSHQAIMDGDHLIVFGGSNVPFGQSNSNELYVCNVQTCVWSRIDTAADSPTDMPTPRYGHTMVRHGHCLYVFAGTAGCVYYNDLYKLDMRTLKWKKLLQYKPETAHPLANQYPNMNMYGRPSPRYRHEAVADDEYMYVIGGGTPNPGDNPVDVFTYHFATNTWERRMCRSAMADGALPIARRSHTCILYNKKIYMFGGTDGHTMYFDFWCLDLETFTWQPIRLHPDAAGAKCFHAAAVTPQGAMYIFGGCADSNGTARSKDVSMCYIQMPSLVDLCANALGRHRVYSPDDVHEMGVADERLAELICDMRK